MSIFIHFIIKCISHIYYSYTNVRKGHPHACTDAHACLIFLKKHITIQSEGYSWRMLYRCKVTFGPLCMCYHTFSLHNKAAVNKPAGKLLSLKWKPHHDELLSTVYCRNGYLGTWSYVANTLTLAAEHMPKHTEQWKIKNTASHIIQTQTDSYSMGFFLGVKWLEHEAGQKLYLLCS